MSGPDSPLTWTALFVASPSPGAIFRFLERQAGRLTERRAAVNALDLRLSEAAGNEAYRALVSVGADRAAFRTWAEDKAPEMSAAFPAAPVLLYTIDGPAWTVSMFQAGAAADRREHAMPAETPQWWRGLAGRAPTPSERATDAVIAHAARRHLPLHVFPASGLRSDRRSRRSQADEIDYTIVARLDQKGLLEEGGPRLYRFTL